MIFTDDYTPFHNEADYCEEKNETQDKQIEELSNKLKQLKEKVQGMQNLINGLGFKIDDKYEAQTQTLSQNITDAVNTLQNALANKTSSALVEADHVQTKTLNADRISTSSISADSTISASVYTGSNINTGMGKIGTFDADVESIQKSTIYYLNAVNAAITNLNMTNLNAETFESRLATIDSLTSGMSTIARLNADLVTVSDSGEWHEPTAQPNNDELLKVSFPYYGGIINIVSQNDSLNLSIVNNTLVTFSQKDFDLYRVDFNRGNKNGHFEYKTDDSSITLPLFETGKLEVSVGSYHTVMELVYGVEKSENLSDTTYFSYDGGNTLIMSYPYGSEVTATFDCIFKTPKPTVDLYFRKSFNYKEIHIGDDKYDKSFSKIVDRTLYENNINVLTGTVSATDITYGDNINVSVMVLDELPEEGTKNTIYVVRNDRSYFYDTEYEKFEPMSLKTDIVSGHIIKGRIDESLIYPVVQYTPDHSLSAFSGTFYKVTDFIESDQIPTGANFMYLESGNIKFCYTSLPPHHGTQFGTSNEVSANKGWFNNIEWDYTSSTGVPFMIPLQDFEYKVPAITISDEAGHSETVDAHKVQDYVVNKQNEINNLLDLRSEGNFIRSIQNKEDIATNRANIKTNADGIKAINDARGQPNGFASLDSEGHLPVEQLPTSALVYQGQWDASSGAYPVQTTYITGDFYIVSVEGTTKGIKFYVGDWIIWNGSAWERSANANAVASVNGKTGAVVLNGADIKLTSDSNVDLAKAVNDGAGDKTYTFTLDGSTYTVANLFLSGPNIYRPCVYTYSSTGTPYAYELGVNGWSITTLSNGSIVGITKIMAQLVADSFINWQTKQEKLVSGTNIKTINNKSLLGSGNLTLADFGISIV